MKITRLKLEQFRQFRDPITLDHFEPGLNIIHGPNESGKSTLVRGIQAAFFERYSTTTVKDLQPWGDSGAAPAVAVDFEHDGRQYQLKKRFLKSKRCDLQMGSESLNGDEAEDYLAEWLGYEYPGRGGSKPEHWGVPGLLWVEQGTGHELQAVEHAQEHLEGALDNMLGEVASSGGDDVIDAVRQQKGQLLTATGRPTGELKAVTKDLEEQLEEVQSLQAQVEQYREEVDRLGHLQQTQSEEEKTRPWEAAEKAAAEARKRFEGIQGQLKQREDLSQRLEEAIAQRDTLQSQLEALRAQDQSLADRARAKEAAEKQLNTLEGRKKAREKTAAEARAQYQKARQTLETVRNANRRQELEDQAQLQQNQLKRTEDNRHKAQQRLSEIQQLKARGQKLTIDEAALKQLKTLEDSLKQLQIRQEATATRLSWQLESGQGAKLDGDALGPKGERLLLAESQFTIEGVGQLRIAPGGEDTAQLKRQLSEAEQERDRQFEQRGVASLEEAEQQRREVEQIERELAQHQALLEELAPEGLDQLTLEQSTLASALEQTREQLASLKEPAKETADDALPDLTRAEGEVERNQLWLEEEEAQQRQEENQWQQARHELASAEREWQKLKDELDSETHKTRCRETEQTMAECETRIKERRQALEECQKSIDEAQPDLLQQDIERYQSTATNQRQQHDQRNIDIHRLQSALQARGADGLEETYQEALSKLHHLNRRHDELEQRARSLELLLNLLEEKRQALVARLQAPLQKRLDHYLKMLFPQAELAVNEALLPEHFSRGQNHGTLEELSFGAREQLGLISRLAYADLLKEAGRPTLIILDDSLVNSDTDRLEKMERVIYDAAQRHQVIILTCHPENYKDLGVAPRDLQLLKTSH